MAGQNRLLRGNTVQTRGNVHGNITIEPGDLIFINSIDGCIGPAVTTKIQADYYMFPLTSFGPPTSTTDHQLAQMFAGVAMTGSANGVTNEITVAEDGIFRYPVIPLGGDVTMGAKVSAVSWGYNTTGGSSVQHVAANADRDLVGGSGSTAFLGIIVKTESGASFVDFQMVTAASGGSIV